MITYLNWLAVICVSLAAFITIGGALVWIVAMLRGK